MSDISKVRAKAKRIAKEYGICFKTRVISKPYMEVEFWWIDDPQTQFKVKSPCELPEFLQSWLDGFDGALGVIRMGAKIDMTTPQLTNKGLTT